MYVSIFETDYVLYFIFGGRTAKEKVYITIESMVYLMEVTISS